MKYKISIFKVIDFFIDKTKNKKTEANCFGNNEHITFY